MKVPFTNLEKFTLNQPKQSYPEINLPKRSKVQIEAKLKKLQKIDKKANMGNMEIPQDKKVDLKGMRMPNLKAD